MDCPFVVGQKVVFVGYPEKGHASYHNGQRVERKPFLDEGGIYTIRGISERRIWKSTRWAGPSLYVGVDDAALGKVWHHHSGFRPLVARSTSISIFTEMLNRSPAENRRELEKHNAPMELPL